MLWFVFTRWYVAEEVLKVRLRRMNVLKRCTWFKCLGRAVLAWLIKRTRSVIVSLRKWERRYRLSFSYQVSWWKKMKNAPWCPCNRIAQLSVAASMNFEAQHHHSAFPKRLSTQCPHNWEGFSTNTDGFYLPQMKDQTGWEWPLAEKRHFMSSKHSHRWVDSS